MFADKPVREDTKSAVPDPSDVVKSEVVGLDEVAQQTPLVVIEAPSSLIVVPPLVALEQVIEVTVFVVVIEGGLELQTTEVDWLPEDPEAHPPPPVPAELFNVPLDTEQYVRLMLPPLPPLL